MPNPSIEKIASIALKHGSRLTISGGYLAAKQSSAWRWQSVGSTMFAAADLCVREKLAVVHKNGFGMVTEVLLPLFQNLDLDGTRLTTIAARARMTKPSMLELVDKAEALGFVARQPDPQDARAKIILFTPTGLQLLEIMRKGVTQAERHLARAVGASFVAELKTMLTRYVDIAINQAGGISALKMSQKNTAWRMQSVSRVLFSATDIFVRDILHHLQQHGFPSVSEVHITLFRHLDLEGTRLTEIAARAGMTKQAMLELVDKAETLGFVERRPDPLDRRAKIVSFTLKGEEMLGQLRLGVAYAERRLVKSTSKSFVETTKTQLKAYTEAYRHKPPARGSIN
jgi:DNA-binding MarR family transcriptional regulator